MAVAEDMSKVVPLEDQAGRGSRLDAQMGDRHVSRAHEAVAKVRAEVDKLSEKVGRASIVTLSGYAFLLLPCVELIDRVTALPL